MKNFTSNYRFLLLAFFSIFIGGYTIAQNPCDQCNDPWGPVQTVTITSQTISTKPSTCLYTFVYEYRERMCNGVLEFELVSVAINQENSGTFCALTNFSDCYNSRRAAIRSLVDLIGQPITFSQEKACYALFEVDPPQDFIDCILSPGEHVDIWYSYIECDANSCCSITYMPNGNGTVDYVTNSSVPCTPGPAPALPPHVIWECNGQSYIIPVDQGQPINCEDACSSGSGTIYKQADIETLASENNQFTLFPNPTNGDITLNYSVTKTKQMELIVYNALGKLVFNEVINVSNGSESVTLATENWGAGIYTMRIQGDGQLLDSQRIQVIK